MNFKLDARSRSRLTMVAVLLAPAIAVQAVRWIIPGRGTPAQAQAAPTPMPEASTTAAKNKPMTQAQAAALAWVRTQNFPRPLMSPMEQPPLPAPKAEPITSKPSAPTEIFGPPDPYAARRAQERPSNLALTGIIGTEAQSLVTINHRVYRVGDTVSPGWVIREIDPRLRQAILEGPDGDTITLEPATPTVGNTP